MTPCADEQLRAGEWNPCHLAFLTTECQVLEQTSSRLQATMKPMCSAEGGLTHWLITQSLKTQTP